MAPTREKKDDGEDGKVATATGSSPRRLETGSLPGRGRSLDVYPDTGESGDAYDVEAKSALNIRRVARLFGLTIGIISTSYFVYVFWLLLHGYVVPLYETNSLVATTELVMASVGLAVLVGILLGDVAGRLWPTIFRYYLRIGRRIARQERRALLGEEE